MTVRNLFVAAAFAAGIVGLFADHVVAQEVQPGGVVVTGQPGGLTVTGQPTTVAPSIVQTVPGYTTPGYTSPGYTTNSGRFFRGRQGYNYSQYPTYSVAPYSSNSFYTPGQQQVIPAGYSNYTPGTPMAGAAVGGCCGAAVAPASGCGMTAGCGAVATGGDCCPTGRKRGIFGRRR